MVEINNQRKAFLDMLAWSEGTDNGRQKARNHGYDVIVGEAIYWLLRSPSRACHVGPNSNQQAPDATQLLSRWWDAYRKQLGLKTSLRKVGTLYGEVRMNKAWRFTYDWSWWYPSGNRPLQQYLGFTARRWLPSVPTWADSLIAKFKEAGGTVREIDMTITAVISLWLSASSSACHGLLIITVITPLPTKPSATKSMKSEAGERSNYWHADASAWCCCARCKIHQELADAKAEKDDVCVMMLPLVVVGCTSKQSVSQCVKPPPPPAWIMPASPTGRHRWTGLFHPQRADHMQKQLEGTQKYINEQCR